MANPTDTYQWPLNTGPVRFSLEDFDDGATPAVIKLPPGAIITRGLVVVQTAFDAETTATLKVGDADTDDRYLSSGDISDAGVVELVPTGHVHAEADELILTYASTGDAAGEGEGYIELEIIVQDRVNESVT